MLGSHASTTTVCRLDLDIILLAHGFNFLILRLHVLEFHRLHINGHGLLVHLPEVEGFGKFASV